MTRVARRGHRAVALTAMLAAMPRALAAAEPEPDEAPGPAPGRLLQGFAALDRPTGMAEGGVGVLTLPAAEVCAERRVGCKRGDLSFALEAWQLYRADRRLAFGAGLVAGLIPTAHPPHDDPDREQTRSYLTVEGAVRYYPYVGEKVEAWLGLTGGLVVINDRFRLIDDTDDRALLGTRGVSIRTEGATLGPAIGGAYELGQRWAFIGTLRYAVWFLPDEPAQDPGGRQASLTGENQALSVAVGLSYRVTL